MTEIILARKRLKNELHHIRFFLNFNKLLRNGLRFEHNCDYPLEKSMFQDIDDKIQVRTYLNFDVNVLNKDFSPWIITSSRMLSHVVEVAITIISYLQNRHPI